MARVYVTRNLPGSALDRLGAAHDVEVWPGREPPSPEDLLAGLGRAEAAITMLTDRVDRETLEQAQDLRALANYAVGTDNIDLPAASRRGIPVGNTPDVLTDSTADLAVALMLAIMRRLPEAEAVVREGEWRTWEPAALLGRDLHRSAVLVIGSGRIGNAVARRLQGFGAEVTTVGRGAELEPLLSKADVVTLHCPLTNETRGLIGEAALRSMPAHAYLVNTARGPVVDTGALERALREGWIAGAALDVTDPEPLPAGHPLLDAPNLLVVPHVGSATHHTREAMADMAVDNILRGLEGEQMPWCANPEVYGH